jgi:hypothetical protein
MQAKQIGEYLVSNDGTGRLVPQAALLLTIRRRLSAALPDYLRRSCTIANYKQGIVVIFASNNAVGAKLRLLAPKLIEALGKHGMQVTGITVHVQAGSSFGAQPIEKKALSLSPSASNSLARLSEKLPTGRLKHAIDALAEKTSNPTRKPV